MKNIAVNYKQTMKKLLLINYYLWMNINYGVKLNKPQLNKMIASFYQKIILLDINGMKQLQFKKLTYLIWKQIN